MFNIEPDRYDSDNTICITLNQTRDVILMTHVTSNSNIKLSCKHIMFVKKKKNEKTQQYTNMYL